MKLFEIDDTINIDDFKKCVFNTFRFNKKEKKIFNKYFDLYAIDKESFTIDFVHSFSKKVFSTKEATRMEFIYIDHYLESSFNSFYSSFVTVIA